MSRTAAKRERTLAKLAAIGCKPVLAAFDRSSASHAIGMSDGSGYFTPTFATEGAALDFAAGNMGRVERHVLRGEPLEPHLFIAHVVGKAAEEHGHDREAFAEALEPRMDELLKDAEQVGDRDVERLVDEISARDLSVDEILDGLAVHLGCEFPRPPRP